MITQSKLSLQEIIKQLNIDQFTRLCSLIDTKFKKGVKFDVISVRPFRNKKDECLIAIDILLESHKDIKTFDIHEKT